MERCKCDLYSCEPRVKQVQGEWVMDYNQRFRFIKSEGVIVDREEVNGSIESCPIRARKIKNLKRKK